MEFVYADLVLLLLHVVFNAVINEIFDGLSVVSPDLQVNCCGNNNLGFPSLSSSFLLLVMHPERPAFVCEQMHSWSRLIFDLRLLLIILGLENNLPPLSIFFLNSAFQLSFLFKNLFVM